jgi:hypothetical protein
MAMTTAIVMTSSYHQYHYAVVLNHVSDKAMQLCLDEKPSAVVNQSKYHKIASTDIIHESVDIAIIFLEFLCGKT